MLDHQIPVALGRPSRFGHEPRDRLGGRLRRRLGRPALGSRQCLSRIAVHRIGREQARSEEHTSELQSPCNLVCRLLLEKKKSNAAQHRWALVSGPPRVHNGTTREPYRPTVNEPRLELAAVRPRSADDICPARALWVATA